MRSLVWIGIGAKGLVFGGRAEVTVVVVIVVVVVGVSVATLDGLGVSSASLIMASSIVAFDMFCATGVVVFASASLVVSSVPWNDGSDVLASMAVNIR